MRHELWVLCCGSWVQDLPCIHIIYIIYFYAVSNALSQQQLCLQSLCSVYTKWLVSGSQFWCKNVQLTGVSTITKAATARLLANTCISAIFNQSYLSIPTLLNEEPYGCYKADAWWLILSFHEINKSWPKWRQKSHEMFARKWLKSLVAATTHQLFCVSQKLICCSFLLLEMPTKIHRTLYPSCRVTWVLLFHLREFWNKQASSTPFSFLINAFILGKHACWNCLPDQKEKCL